MDMATSRHMFETYHPKPLEIVCFHAQQAAEKMLKCYLVSREVEAPKIHDMRRLCEMCAELEKSFDEIYNAAVLLTRYGVIPRYPAELGLIERDAIKAIEHASDVMSFVVSVLNREGNQT
jgi:HEPN domain-containing protein